MVLIGGSVGLGGSNKPTDVALIQQLLNLTNSSSNLSIDGLINQRTIVAIAQFQKTVAKLSKPDSLINTNGHTLKLLIKVSGYNPAIKLSSTFCSILPNRFITLYNKQYQPLSPPRHKGLTDLLGFFARDKDITNIRWMAYMLATTMHETDRTWLPIEEYGKGGIRPYAKEIEVTDKAGKKYKNVYYGRGYVQLTWEKNYKDMSKALELGDELHIHPEKALEPDVAYQILSQGMRNGSFTAKKHKLSDFIIGTSADYFHARRIINLLDKAQLIQSYAETLEQLLRLSQNQTKQTRSVVECTPVANRCSA